MAPKVFVDGAAGTTGLRIHKRLAERSDIELIVLEEELRKELDARRLHERAARNGRSAHSERK